MRMKLALVVGAVGAVLLAPPASGQIISTSIPLVGKGISADKRVAFHFMVSPFAKWNYGEVFIGALDQSAEGLLLGFGSVNATPTSDILIAGEAVFALGDSPWSVSLGGWYNKIGTTDFDFGGDFLLISDIVATGAAEATLGGDLDLFEGHVGIFYKDFGVQTGLVRTTGQIGETLSNFRLTFAGQQIPLDGVFEIESFEGKTTDWDLFGVYKKAGEKWGVSVGAGIYRKQGIESAEVSPLRDADDQTVFSGFISANIAVWKGLGLDVSYWYVGETGTIESESFEGTVSSDSQSRFTVGIGYTF